MLAEPKAMVPSAEPQAEPQAAVPTATLTAELLTARRRQTSPRRH